MIKTLYHQRIQSWKVSSLFIPSIGTKSSIINSNQINFSNYSFLGNFKSTTTTHPRGEPSERDNNNQRKIRVKKKKTHKSGILVKSERKVVLEKDTLEGWLETEKNTKKNVKKRKDKHIEKFLHNFEEEHFGERNHASLEDNEILDSTLNDLEIVHKENNAHREDAKKLVKSVFSVITDFVSEKENKKVVKKNQRMREFESDKYKNKRETSSLSEDDLETKPQGVLLQSILNNLKKVVHVDSSKKNMTNFYLETTNASAKSLHNTSNEISEQFLKPLLNYTKSISLINENSANSVAYERSYIRGINELDKLIKMKKDDLDVVQDIEITIKSISDSLIDIENEQLSASDIKITKILYKFSYLLILFFQIMSFNNALIILKLLKQQKYHLHHMEILMILSMVGSRNFFEADKFERKNRKKLLKKYNPFLLTCIRSMIENSKYKIN